MKTTDYIKLELENSKGWALGLIGDMKDAPLTQPTDKGGNHPLWVLGHITYSESSLLDEFILGNENRFPEYKELFGMTSTPSTDASQYPALEELMGKFEEIRAATFAHLETLSDEDLDQPSKAPEEFGPGFSKIGGVFGAMSIHSAFHAGQVADARRAAGRKPMMS